MVGRPIGSNDRSKPQRRDSGASAGLRQDELDIVLLVNLDRVASAPSSE
jgi:hypothetical protein